MNTANLQIEGVLLALAALCETLERKGMLSREEIETALQRAEGGVSARKPELSEANTEAIRFPIRFLQLALQRGGEPLDYHAITAEIGRMRDRERT